jgi:sec-independent protein translocase protein TatA
MLGYGMPELIIILVLALVVFGPQKLPELARTLGRALAELKRTANDFKRSIEEEAERSREVENKNNGEGVSGEEAGVGKVDPAEKQEKKNV